MPYIPQNNVPIKDTTKKTIGVAYPWYKPDFRLVRQIFDKTVSQGQTVKDILKKQGL